MNMFVCYTEGAIYSRYVKPLIKAKLIIAIVTLYIYPHKSHQRYKLRPLETTLVRA
jgi:hypothetical protein